MKRFLIIAFNFVQLLLNAQDTIYKRSGDIIPARVIEINTKEISYKREDLQDGPLFVLNKNEVKKIKYKTGAVDSFTVYRESPVKPTNPNVMVYTYNDQMQKARMKGTYVYQGRTISDTKAMLLIDNKNRAWKDQQLATEILNMRKNKTLQYTTGFGGLGLGLLTMAATVVAFNDASANATTPLVLCGNAIGVIIAAQVVSVHFKIKRIKHSDKAVALYNRNL